MFDGVAALYFLLKIILANTMTLEMDTAPWDASLQACAKPLPDVSRLASDLFSAKVQSISSHSSTKLSRSSLFSLRSY
jgi:hypothetical protein